MFEYALGDEPFGPERKIAGGPLAVAFAEIRMRHEQCQHAVHSGAALAKAKRIPEAVAAPVWVMEPKDEPAK